MNTINQVRLIKQKYRGMIDERQQRAIRGLRLYNTLTALGRTPENALQDVRLGMGLSRHEMNWIRHNIEIPVPSERK